MKQTSGINDSLRDNETISKKENEDDITPIETELLHETESSTLPDTEDESKLRNGTLDKTDKDGDLLNEEDGGDEFSGSDLDVPGTEDDDEDENIGEEDEENNIYSPGQK